nr:hypothetical protein [Desulforhabdus sp. TSK]
MATVSPDGRWVASTTADADGRTDGITVVDMKTGTEACRVEHQMETGKTVARFEHGAPLFQANFSHDGQSLLTVSADRLKLWHADPKWPFDQLCERSGRNLSREEWRTFIGESEAWRPTCPDWHTPEVAASAGGLPPIGP